MPPNQAFAALKNAVRSDAQCARNWHATVATLAVQEGVDPATAERIAWRFLSHYFEIVPPFENRAVA